MEGSYLNDATFEIAIVDTTFYFVIAQGAHLVFENDTLAKCSIKRIGDNFIELNSEHPVDIVRKSMRIVQEYDSTLIHNKQVVFDFPCQRKVEIEVITNKFKHLNLEYSSHNRSLILPVQTQSFSYIIYLKELPMPILGSVCFGIIQYDPLQEIKFEDDKNIIHIYLPAINDTFFERFFIQGEYAIICGDSINWKGNVFIKSK